MAACETTVSQGNPVGGVIVGGFENRKGKGNEVNFPNYVSFMLQIF